MPNPFAALKKVEGFEPPLDLDALHADAKFLKLLILARRASRLREEDRLLHYFLDCMVHGSCTCSDGGGGGCLYCVRP